MSEEAEGRLTSWSGSLHPGKALTGPDLQMGHPPNPGVGYLVGIWQPFLIETTLTPWLGFQANEAF